MMMDKLFDALLKRVFYPITAIVSFDAPGNLLGVTLVDTLFAELEGVVFPGSSRVAVLCHHPDGCLFLREEDRLNIGRIAESCEGIALSVYICGEDIGCFEVDSREFCAIMGENAI